MGTLSHIDSQKLEKKKIHYQLRTECNQTFRERRNVYYYNIRVDNKINLRAAQIAFIKLGLLFVLIIKLPEIHYTII